MHSAKAGLTGRLCVASRPIRVFQPHAWSFQASNNKLKGIVQVWERFAAKFLTDKIICVSEDEERLGRRYGVKAPTVVVKNGVDLQYFRPRDRAEARYRLGLGRGPIVVCVGRISQQKGQDLLLRLWPQVRSRFGGCRLVLVGSINAELDDLRDIIARDESVIWFDDAADVRDFYASCDVTVLPSRWEGMALVPLEATAMGRTVVGFMVGGLHEAIPDTTLLVEQCDISALAERICAVLERSIAGKLLEQRIRDYAIENMDQNAGLEKVRAVYAELLERLDRPNGQQRTEIV